MKTGHGYTVDSGNPARLELIKELKAKENPVWKSLAKRLSRSRRNRYEVTVADLSELGGGATLIVPGTVLSNGELKGKVSVAALKFTAGARKKIEAAGGQCVSISELLAENPAPSSLRIVG